MDCFLVKHQVIEMIKKILPKFNSVVFFEVSDRSSQQIVDLLSKFNTNLTISGWFHLDHQQHNIANPLLESIAPVDNHVSIHKNLVMDLT